MKVRIDVTEDDIRIGKRMVPCECPVAMAIRRASPDKRDGFGVYFTLDHGQWAIARLSSDSDSLVFAESVELPAEVVEFAWRFDLGKPVEPFSFELELP